MTNNELSLLLADCRQALFAAIRFDAGASQDLRFECGRAIGLMGKAINALTGGEIVCSRTEFEAMPLGIVHDATRIVADGIVVKDRNGPVGGAA